MAKILEFKKPERVATERIEIPELLRDYDQCRIQQEHAFMMKRYYEIMMVDNDPRRCFVRKTEKMVAAQQIAMRNGGVMPPQFS